MASRLAEAFIEITARTGRLRAGLGSVKRTVTKELGALSNAADRIMAAGAIGGLLGFGGGFDVSRVAANFEQSMAGVRAVFGLIGREGAESFDLLRAKALEMGATTQFSATQAAEALEKMGLAGLTTAESITALPKALELAAAGEIDIATAAKIAANNMRAFGKDASFLSEVNDTLAATFTNANTDILPLAEALRNVAPIARSAGISIQDVSAILAKMADAGFTGGRAGTALRNAIIQLENRDTASVSKGLAQIGLAAEDLEDTDGKLLPIVEVMRKLEQAGLSTTSAIAIFGKRGGPEFLAAVEGIDSEGRKGADAVEALADKIRAAGGLAGKIAKTKLATFTGAITLMKSALEGAKITIGTSLNEALLPYVEGISKAFAAIAKFNKGTADTIVKVGILSATFTGLFIVIGKGLPLLFTLVGGFSALLSPLVLIVGAIALVGTALHDAFGDLELGQRLKVAVNSIVKTFGNLLGFVSLSTKGIRGVVSSMWDGLKERAVRAVEFVAEAIKSWQPAFVSVASFVSGTLLPVWDALKFAFTNIKEVAIEVFGSIRSFLVENSGKFMAWGRAIREIIHNLSDIFIELVQGFRSGWDSAIAFVGPLFKKIATGFTDGVSVILNGLLFLTTNWRKTWALMVNIAEGGVIAFKLGIMTSLQLIKAGFAGAWAFIGVLVRDVLQNMLNPFGVSVDGFMNGAIKIKDAMVDAFTKTKAAMIDFALATPRAIGKAVLAMRELAQETENARAAAAGEEPEDVGKKFSEGLMAEFEGAKKNITDSLAKAGRAGGEAFVKTATDFESDPIGRATGDLLDQQRQNLKERADIVDSINTEAVSKIADRKKARDELTEKIDSETRLASLRAERDALKANADAMAKTFVDGVRGALGFGAGRTRGEAQKERIEAAAEGVQSAFAKIGQFVQGGVDVALGKAAVDNKELLKDAESSEVSAKFVGVRDLGRQIQESLSGKKQEKVQANQLDEQKLIKTATQESSTALQALATAAAKGFSAVFGK